jgi:hypothetical protein
MLGDLGRGDTTVAAWVAGPFLAACALLVWSGAAKLRQPRWTRAAAHALGLPATPRAVRALGVVEVSAAVVGAGAGHLGAVAVAFVYGGLTIAALRLLRQAPATPCGCLGSSDAPVSYAHVIVNAGAVLVAVAAAFGGSPLARITDLPLAGVPFVALVLCGVWLATLMIDALPALQRATKEGAR